MSYITIIICRPMATIYYQQQTIEISTAKSRNLEILV